MFPRKPHKETPVERIFREVAGRKMNRAERYCAAEIFQVSCRRSYFRNCPFGISGADNLWSLSNSPPNLAKAQEEV